VHFVTNACIVSFHQTCAETFNAIQIYYMATDTSVLNQLHFAHFAEHDIFYATDVCHPARH